MNEKPILCLDFDGVLHSYKSGWKGADVIPDPPVDGAMKFVWDASEHLIERFQDFREAYLNADEQTILARHGLQEKGCDNGPRIEAG